MKLGLAFSGGGARGVAHLGVLKALEEFDIHPQILSGVSAGAFAGSFYAAGFSPEEALDFVQRTRFISILNYTYRKPGIFNTERHREALEKVFPHDSFDQLNKELFIIATDLVAAKQKVFRNGSLIDAILASSAFPFLYSPVNINGVVYADGGIINNLPSDILIDKCDKIIGIFVNPMRKMKKPNFRSAISIMERAYEITKIEFNRPKYKYCDWLIQPEKLTQFQMFDTRSHKSEEIFNIGYEDGLRWAEIIAKDLQQQEKENRKIA